MTNFASLLPAARLPATAASRVMRRARRAWLASLAGIAAIGCASTAWAAPVQSAEEPWNDNDPGTAPDRLAVGEFGFSGGAEYRAQGTYINPISLNTITERRASFIEHRLRLDGMVDYQEKVKLVTSLDVMDGVLWGDNGNFGGVPSSENGTTINARNSNDTVACVGYKGGESGNPLSADDYGYTLCEPKTLRFRRLYGEVLTPVGLIRVGRQPFNVGYSLQGATGDGRANRFGIAREGNFVDRVIFGTKPLEAFKPKEQRDLSVDNGLFVAAFYDHLVSDQINLFADDARQVGGAVFYRAKDYADAPIVKDVFALGYGVARWSDATGSQVAIFGGRTIARFGPVFIGLDAAANVGSTREIAEAYRVISNDPVVDQKILQFGARGVVRYDHPVVRAGEEQQPGISAYVEVNYASGDADPQARTPLSQFVWAPDTNVGLLMFEHVLRFQSARAAAAATETLRRLGATTFPVDAIDTRGSFTNAFAVFPQFDFRPHRNVLFRTGLLVAWAAEPVVDPVQSLLGRDGEQVEDDLVNFAGGAPGSFYGAEIDLRAQWRFMDHFALDLESAVFFPGDAFADENGDAARSVLVQGRTTFFF
jgi:hypothetical protein